jgi:urease gamma subunit
MPMTKKPMTKKAETKDSKGFGELAREYFAPAGIGVLVGAIGTIATVLPQLIDKTKELVAQRAVLSQIEQDISAYSKVVRQIYPILTAEQIGAMFKDKGTVLVTVDKGKMDDDTWVAAELHVSPEGAYFVWCRSGMNSEHSGASTGFWLTRPEAMAWVDSHASSKKLREVFGDDAFKQIGGDTSVGLCE